MVSKCFFSHLRLEKIILLSCYLYSFSSYVNLFFSFFNSKPGLIEKEANLWAKNKTNGLIDQVLPKGSVESSSRFIFANALYFKGAWKEKFKAKITKNYEFYLENGSCVENLFMTSYERQFIGVHDDFKVLGLPYEQGMEDRRRHFTMYIFLPDAKDGLKDLVEKASSDETGFFRTSPSKEKSCSW